MKSAGWLILWLLLVSIPVHAQANPWEMVGDIIETDSAHRASIAIAPDGTLYVSTAGFQIFRQDGAAWEDISPGTTGSCTMSGTRRDLQIAIAPDGTPYIAWQSGVNGTSQWNIYACLYNGAAWDEAGDGSSSGGGISNTPETSQFPALAIDPSGTPYVAWSDAGNGSSSATAGVYVRRFNGTTWEEVGAGSASCCGGGISQGQGPGHSPDISINLDGTVYVAWKCLFYGGSDQICARRFNGSSWEEVGAGSATFPTGLSNTSGGADYPSLTIGPGGIPYVTWQQWATFSLNGQGYTNWEIYVRRFNGAAWEEIGTASASSGGISTTVHTHSLFPSITFTGDGVPYVSWTELTRGFTATEFTLFVRRFNGAVWEETHSGSATVGGIDTTNGDEPEEVALESQGGPMAFVAYPKATTSGSGIAVRSFNYSAPSAAPARNFVTIPNPTLAWNPVAWATAYEIQIDRAPGFTSPVIPYTELTPDTLAYTPPDLASATYYWRVRARKPDDTRGAWSVRDRFTILLP